MRETGRGAPRRSACVDIRVDRSGRETVIVLAGDLDVRSTAVVRTAVHDQLRGVDGPLVEPFVIDITEVGSVDATALRVLAAASRQAQRYGVRLVLRGACPAVRRMLHLTRLIRVIEVERDETRVG